MLVASYSYHKVMTEIIENRENLIGKTKSLNVQDTFWQISLEPSHDQCSQPLRMLFYQIAIAMTLISGEIPIESLRYALWAMSFVNSNKKISS